MTTQLVRKQIYIQKRQDILLKRLAQVRGISEAELIRQAIEREFSGGEELPLRSSSEIFQEFKSSALAQRNKGIKGSAHSWYRQELYQERENRWLRETSDEPEE